VVETLSRFVETWRVNCPRDHAPLQQATHRGVTVDVCTQCEGKWLDPGELEQLVLARTHTGATPAAFNTAMAAAERPVFLPVDEGDPPLTCPRCGVEMQKVSFESHGTRITADRCEKCKGLWLDPGEEGSLFVFLEEKLPIRGFVWAIVAVVGLGLLALVWLVAR
jgi:Zn-finger nucleic acid-binding protein